MEVSLTLLRSNSDVLLSVLEPFLQDPTVAWGRSGRAQLSSAPMTAGGVGGGGGGISAAGAVTAAVQDQENAEAKEALKKISGRLSGVYNIAHPRAEQMNRAHIQRFKTPLIKGLGASKKGELPLSVSGQVQRLIDEATAEVNLAQMYIGNKIWLHFLHYFMLFCV